MTNRLICVKQWEVISTFQKVDQASTPLKNLQDLLNI